jgi:acyl carrier protein
MSEITESVREFILVNFLPGEDGASIGAHTDLKDGGILDSLSTLKLVSFLEERYGVEIQAEDLDSGRLSSIEGIAQLVQSRIK